MTWIQGFISRVFHFNDEMPKWLRPFLLAFSSLGDFSLFCWQTLRWTFLGKFRGKILFKESLKIGVKSTFIILLVGLFSGMVFALQTGYSFRLFNAESLVGSTVGIALSRELAPVFTSLMVVARAGSAMAAEIGTMRVTEQVDALRSMAVSPISYLVVPKVLATTFMVPLLVMVFNAFGLLGAYVVAVHLLDIPEGPYLYWYHYYLSPQDYYQGIIKGFLFGLLLSLIACRQGYRTTHGAEGVGRSTTVAVVAGSVAILVVNYFLATWLLHIFPPGE